MSLRKITKKPWLVPERQGTAETVLPSPQKHQTEMNDADSGLECGVADVQSGSADVRRNPRADALTGDDDHQRHRDVFEHFGSNTDIAVAREHTGECDEKRESPNDGNDDGAGDGQQQDQKHEADGKHESRREVSECSDERVAFLKPLGFLIDVNAEGVGTMPSATSVPSTSGSASLCSRVSSAMPIPLVIAELYCYRASRSMTGK